MSLLKLFKFWKGTKNMAMKKFINDPLDLTPELLEGLEIAGPFIRRELSKVLSIRRIPELRFQRDTTLDSATRIEEVLREVLPPDEEAGEE